MSEKKPSEKKKYEKGELVRKDYEELSNTLSEGPIASLYNVHSRAPIGGADSSNPPYGYDAGVDPCNICV